MSLNARIALLALLAVLSSPVWLPLSPWLLLCWRRDVRAARTAGYRCLTASMVRTIVAHAEVTTPWPPDDGYERVARNVDDYLAAVRSPRHWRTSVVLLTLDFAPWLRGRPRLSRMSTADRRRFLDRHMRTTRGLLGIPALARQLVRIGYYGDAGVAKRIGFVPVGKGRTARATSAAPGSQVRGAAG